jgi:hypothetical protein
MSDSKELENERNQQVRMQCIDYATRIVGKAAYITDGSGEIKKYQDDVIEVAEQIHKFVTG